MLPAPVPATICVAVSLMNFCLAGGQWRLVAFINGGASKTIIEMSKSSIYRLPKFLVVFRLTVILACM